MKRSNVLLLGNKKNGWILDVTETNKDLVFSDSIALTHEELLELQKIINKKLSNKLNEE